MIKKTLLKTMLCGGVVFVSVFLGTYATKATDCEDSCKTAYPDDRDAQDSCYKKCKALDEQEKDVQKMLQLNDKTQNSLSGQLGYIDQQQSTNQQSLSVVQNKLGSLSSQIESLKRSISEKEKVIAYQKKILAGLMRSYYDYDQQGLLSIVLLDKDLSVSLAQADYIEQSGVKANDILAEIKKGQQELIKDRKQLEDDYNESDGLKDKLQYEKSNLQSTENQKQFLLEKTQGEEQKYQNMLAHIEEQKQDLFDFSAASNIGEVLASVKKYDRPDKGDWASTSWYYAQTDSRWGNQRIGNSKSLMRDWGCAIASVAMVFRKHGVSTDPKKLAEESKLFYGDLIKWSISPWPSSWPDLKSSTYHGNVNWTTIKSQISRGNPVIVYIKRTSGGGGHYVVITGKDKKDYIVHDPYFGANLYLGTSMSLIGKLGVNSKTRIDQMIIYK